VSLTLYAPKYKHIERIPTGIKALACEWTQRCSHSQTLD